jgi:hypothetical protein
MASVLLLPDPAVLTLLSVEVNEETKMITATAKRLEMWPIAQCVDMLRIGFTRTMFVSSAISPVLGGVSTGSFRSVVSGVRIQPANG